MGGNKTPLPPILTRKSTTRRRDEEGVWRMVNEAHTPRAQDLSELHRLQKQQREKDEAAHAQQAASISQTLRSGVRSQGPRIVKGEPKHLDYSAASPRSLEHKAGFFVKCMSDAGLRPVIVFHNLTTAELYEKALANEEGTHIVSSGALATLSGAKTGRSARDKRLVREAGSDGEVWWGEGSPNLEMDERTFMLNRERAVDYLNMRQRIYVVDGFAGWDPQARYKIRVVCARAYHALFAHNMLIRPTEQELATFGQPDFTIFNAGAFPANRFSSYMTSSTSIDISFKQKEMIILGSQYAGCMKGGVFTAINYWMPKRGVLSLHSGANVGPKDNDVTLFFGLSGTGKTTLTADPKRQLIGDDELCWGDRGIFNVEGGCYAKCIGLKQENEPQIWEALRFGTLLENVVFDEDTRDVDYDNNSITENTRAAYPISFISNARVPCMGPHPRNIIMLCCDAFGVLPPVSRLSMEQAVYYFMSGYTAKVKATESGVTEPRATFSACFGGAFLVWHPAKYASMLAEKMAAHGTTAWLVNTGWTGGSYGTGYRIRLQHTRAIVDAIHSGELAAAEYTTLPVFGLQVPTKVTGVPDKILVPSNTWQDRQQHDAVLRELAGLFVSNFKKFEDGGGYLSAQQAASTVAAGPTL